MYYFINFDNAFLFSIRNEQLINKNNIKMV